MRAPGEGTIQPLPNGKFRGGIWVKGKRVWGPTVSRRADALPALWRKLNQSEDEPEQPLSIYVQSKIDLMHSESYSPTTIELWKAAYKRLGSLSGLTPSEVEPADLKDWWNENHKLAARTRRNYLAIYRQILKPYNDANIKTPSDRKRPPRILDTEEGDRLLRMKMPEPTRVMILLALKMGLRRSEIAGLKHEDRDGDGVMVRRAVVRAKGIIAIKKTKTPTSESWVPVCPELLDVIGEGRGYVLGSEDEPPSPSVLDDRWRRLVRGTEFEGVGLHDLRRSFGMRLLESGVDVRTAAEMMRHDPSMLLKLYTRSRKDLKRKAMSAAFGSVSNSVSETGLGASA